MPDFDEFTNLINEQHASLRLYIGRFGVNAAWIDDLAQDTFLVVYQKWEEFQRVDNPDAWIRGVAKKLILNELAKIHRRQRLLNLRVTELLLEAQQDEPANEFCFNRPETLDTLRLCLASLTEKARGVIEARYYSKRNSFEIGREMTMTPVAVRKILFHARQSLADCMRKNAIEAP